MEKKKRPLEMTTQPLENPSLAVPLCMPPDWTALVWVAIAPWACLATAVTAYKTIGSLLQDPDVVTSPADHLTEASRSFAGSHAGTSCFLR